MSRAPSPAGATPCGEHGRPEIRRDLGRDGALDAVLAGVARAGDQAGGARPTRNARRQKRCTAAAAGATAARRGPRLGALHRDDRPLVGDVGTTDGADDLGRVRRVGHDVEALLVDPPDDDVVDDEAVLVEQVRVLGPAGVDPPQVVAERVLQVLEGVGADDDAPCRDG